MRKILSAQVNTPVRSRYRSDKMFRAHTLLSFFYSIFINEFKILSVEVSSLVRSHSLGWVSIIIMMTMTMIMIKEIGKRKNVCKPTEVSEKKKSWNLPP